MLMMAMMKVKMEMLTMLVMKRRMVMKMMSTAAVSYSPVDCGPHKCWAVDFRVVGCSFSNNIC